MRKIKEVLRFRSVGLNQHQIARSCAISQRMFTPEGGVLYCLDCRLTRLGTLSSMRTGYIGAYRESRTV